MIPRNRAIFCSRQSIESNSAVLNSTRNFLDKNAHNSRTYCIGVIPNTFHDLKKVKSATFENYKSFVPVEVQNRNHHGIICESLLTHFYIF